MTPSPRLNRIGWTLPGMLVACLGVGACVAPPRVTPAPTPHFDAIAFFAGRTEGKGVLKIALHRSETTLVEGEGHVADDGAILLEQTVRRQGKPATRRRWALRRVGVDRYAGTLSDAAGPVDGRVAGNVLRLRFAMKGGLRAEQVLVLRRDGRIADNVMIVRKLGVPMARLDETITRLGR